jgi:hypothetical protein
MELPQCRQAEIAIPLHATVCHAVRTHVSPLVLSALASRLKLSATAWLSIIPVNAVARRVAEEI